MNIQDTIVAPVTPAGEGGVGIVRLSGPESEKFLNLFFRPSGSCESFTSHILYHGRLTSLDGEIVDEVMVVLMRAPRSYTREDVVEVQCHGGPLVIRRIIDLFIESGARLARPGEFTLRAFLNGRVDLAEAEGVIDLISSRSEAARVMALRQMGGKLSEALYAFRDRITDLLAEVETHVDFPDEDIEHADLTRLGEGGRLVRMEMEALLDTFDSGRILREGISVLILGRPNVGKSSLMNALLGESRAIVTEVPGTTRDTIEESLTLGGIPLRLVDTAGVRETEDLVEKEGIRRAREKAASADLVLLVLDGSRPTSSDDLLALEACKGARILPVVNKCDLPSPPLGVAFRELDPLFVSAHSGQGMDELGNRIVSTFGVSGGGEVRESVVLSDRRHRESLLRGKEAMERFRLGVEDGAEAEFLALELRESLQALGEITGETTPDEVLGRIFSRFCIGK